ncbi:hypothetical protein BCV69DRAFT_298632 [Microstroma glucosiphilum]|uniref:Uncharacterized protein n=1 Tax=Pseudomicrostroma glucosiphilum TaxID=1684307 RepID=A0A316UAX6_9BASI|nr:hypothetical protein BCV69DRAFT_298632 [Pseudomicrostroma glucosiphilum]PWN21631.1 hypothetical protein BCV69DRAFT_298632 [Pseudomicrostroma glucosiphilum]
MVNALVFSAALAAASIATVAQAASLKQDPLFGCVSQASGTLSLGTPDDSDAIPAGFVAGRTGKSRITGTSGNSVLSTTRTNGDAVSAQDFEFLNCTQSLIDRGYALRVPNSFANLTTEDTTFTYSWGVLRSSGSTQHSLSSKTAQDSNGRLDGAALLNTKVSETPVEYRTFIMATIDNSTPKFLEYYPFAGTKKAPKAGVFYPIDDKWGTVGIATNMTKHDGSAYLTLSTSG